MAKLTGRTLLDRENSAESLDAEMFGSPGAFGSFWATSDARTELVQIDLGTTLMCGCAACVAEREGGNNQFKAEGNLQPAAAGTGSFPAGAVQAPSYAVNAVVNEYQIQWGSFTPGTAVTVTYSFLTNVPSYYSANADERFQFAAMNAAQKQAARDSFTNYAEVANVTFVEVAAGTGSINLGTANLGSGIGGWAYYPSPGYSGANDHSVAGDVWITNRYSSYTNPTKGSWEYQTYIHEIGHAIGLKHPGNYDAGGGGTPGPYLPTSEDSHQYTVMSYYSGPTYGNVEPITPQLYDIAAIQYLYGINSSTRNGNDSYTFATSLQVKTIWDGGGNDTFNASNQAQAVTIDLRPGSFSSIGGTRNVAIAFGAAIENAIGSSFNDSLTANDASGTLDGRAGNDTLVGGAGVDRLIGGPGIDTLTGNGGADIFSFVSGDSGAASGNRDLISDFTPGTDQIDLSGIDADLSTPIMDAFRFLGTTVFDGLAAALDYFFDTARNVTVLRGDVNGDSAADFAIDLSGSKTLSWADFTSGSVRPVAPLNLTGTSSVDMLMGDALDDTLSGLGGNDTLIGKAGNDYLDGGIGADTMIGSIGNDTYVVDNPGDAVTEVSGPYAPPSGWTIKGTADLNGDGQLDLAVTDGTVNQLWLLKDGAVLSTTALPLTSLPLMGLVDLDGDGDKDVLYQIPDGRQWAQYLNGASLASNGPVAGRVADALKTLPGGNEGTDTVLSSISYALPVGVENLTLQSGAGSINGTGNTLDNIIINNENNNVLTGGAGIDTFVFNPNFGNDVVTDFHPGEDIVRFDHAIFADASSLLSHMIDDGLGNTIIAVDASDTVTLQNVPIATVQQHLSDFHIV